MVEDRRALLIGRNHVTPEFVTPISLPGYGVATRLGGLLPVFIQPQLLVGA
jgi:hypothetical protein